MQVRNIENTEIAGGFDGVGLVGLPYGFDMSFLKEFATLGTLRIIGNSANTGRQKISSSIASEIGVDYVHANLATNIDELHRPQFLEYFPKGVNTFGECLAYQLFTVDSKYGRLTGLPDPELDKLGLDGSVMSMTRSLILLSDSVSITRTGQLREKPVDYDEAMQQIREIVDDGMEYYLSSIQAALWANGAGGIGHSIDLLPLRVSRNLSKFQRLQLKKDWISLYENKNVPVTPGAASASNKEIFPHMEVGLLPKRISHVSPSIYVTDDFLNINLGKAKLVTWIPTPILPGIVKHEIWTSVTGASPFGYLAAMRQLLTDTRSVKARFAHQDKTLALSTHMSGAPVKLPKYAMDAGGVCNRYPTI